MSFCNLFMERSSYSHCHD